MEAKEEHHEDFEGNESMDILFTFTGGALHTKLFSVIMKHSIPDLLEEGPRHYSEISKLIGIKDEESCYRLLRYFVPHKLFNENEDNNGVGIFSKTKISTLFTKSGKYYYLSRFSSHDIHYKIFESLPETMETGRSDAVSKMGLNSFWDLFDKDTSYKELFNETMKEITCLSIDQLVKTIQLSEFKTIADIGGNQGYVVGKLLESIPSLEGINFDIESVIKSTTEKYQNSRLKHVSGDFRQSVPEADYYLLKHTLHNWTDEECVQILKTICKSMKQNGKIIVMELILEPSNYTKSAVYKDILMMQLFNAKERSLPQWKDLFEKADLKIDKIHKNSTPHIMEVSKKQ